MVACVRLLCFFVFPNKDAISRFHSSILYYTITIGLISVACLTVPKFVNSEFMQGHIQNARRE
jgi:hypothetical protein